MKYLFACLMIFICANCIAQSFAVLNHKADSLYKAQKFAESAQAYEEAIKLYPHLATNDVHYNAACSYSLAGNRDKAFEHLLTIARENKYTNFAHIKEDKDLVNLYNDKRWKQFTALVENNYNKIYNVPLQKQLEEIFADDQRVRNKRDTVLMRFGMNGQEYKDVIAEIDRMDSLNDIKIQAIFNKYGWPGPNSPDGQKIDAFKSFFLYTALQHASLETQVKYLPLLKEAVQKGNARPKDFGYVQDRILQRQGKRQLYGTQLSLDKRDNKPFVWPIEDVDNLDKRRKEIGMQSMAADLKMLFNMDWNLQEYKSRLKELEDYVKIKD